VRHTRRLRDNWILKSPTLAQLCDATVAADAGSFVFIAAAANNSIAALSHERETAFSLGFYEWAKLSLSSAH